MNVFLIQFQFVCTVCCVLILAPFAVNCESMAYKVERLSVPDTGLGEGPYWDHGTQSLYYVDIEAKTINCFKYNENKSYTAKIDDETKSDGIGFIIPIKGKPQEFAIGLGSRVVKVEWDSVSPTFSIREVLIEPEGSEQTVNRMNDAKADWKGRLYFGSMNRNLNGRTGYFYSKQKSKGLTQLRDNVGISNGIAWNKANDKMFYIDTFNKKVEVMDYDKETGAVSNPQTYFNFGEIGLEAPDGMTIDKEDNLYVAVFTGNGVYRVNAKTKKIDLEIKIPQVTNTTSAAFGGPNLNELFVTSAKEGLGRTSEHYPNAGGLYKITFTDPSIAGELPNEVDL